MILPNLKHLNYLVALHQHQHFLRAANACYVSQSTLSSAIIKLEEQLNCQLIERDNKSFIFTLQGEEIVEMAKRLINDANDLVQYANAQGNSEKGKVIIGVIPTIAPFLLQEIASVCMHSLPNLELYFIEDTTENLLTQLQNGLIDLAILALPIAGHNFKSRVLAKDPFYIAGDQTLVERYKSSLSYQALPEHSIFLLAQDHCLTEHAITACQLTDKSRIHQFSASSLTTLVQMTALHKGFTFLPEMAVKKGVGKAEGLTIEKLNNDIYREIGMLWRATSIRQKTYFMIGNLVSEILKG